MEKEVDEGELNKVEAGEAIKEADEARCWVTAITTAWNRASGTKAVWIEASGVDGVKNK